MSVVWRSPANTKPYPTNPLCFEYVIIAASRASSPMTAQSKQLREQYILRYLEFATNMVTVAELGLGVDPDQFINAYHGTISVIITIKYK